MKYEPVGKYAYQRQAIDFIKSHSASALLLDMGLGKTVISLTAFVEMRERGLVHNLFVVAPKRVAEISWPDEILLWDHTRDLKFSVIKGDVKHRKKAVETEADIYIISRDNVAWLQKSGLFPPCDMLAMDEMQSFKNPTSARTKAMIALRPKFKVAVGLSGTPAPNSLVDMWAQYMILDLGKTLGSNYWAFLKTHFVPAKTIMRYGRECVTAYRPKPNHAEMLANAIRPMTLSMTAEDHLDLPGISYSPYPAEMEENEKRQYEEFAENLSGYIGGEQLKVPTDEALVGKLVQLANGIAYGNKGETIEFHRHKLDALLELIEEEPNRTMLVVYWFKSDFERLTRELTARHITNADISSDEAVSAWNEGRLQIGLIHPAKAGLGLNLQRGGSKIVWYTLQWNLELYEQTNARLYRNGQKEHVSVVHIMTKDTIDSAIYAKLQKKKMIQDKLFQETSLDHPVTGNGFQNPAPQNSNGQNEFDFGEGGSYFDQIPNNTRPVAPAPRPVIQNASMKMQLDKPFVYKPFNPMTDEMPPLIAWIDEPQGKWAQAWA